MNTRSHPSKGLLIAAVLLGGCAGKSGASRRPADRAVNQEAAGAAAPADAGDAAMDGDDDEFADKDLDTLDAELTEYESELATLEKKRDFSATPASEEAAADRCTRVCTLKSAVCSLEEKICGLADEHEGEPRYQEVCTRARTQCETATAACSDC